MQRLARSVGYLWERFCAPAKEIIKPETFRRPKISQEMAISSQYVYT